MKINIVTIGKTADKTIAEAIDRYCRRIAHYAPFEYIELADVKASRNTTPDRQKELEGQSLLARVNAGDRLILLDERGKELTSVQFADNIRNYMNTLQRNLIFAIGGPYGFSPDVYARADG